jgi:hypothetical protein
MGEGRRAGQLMVASRSKEENETPWNLSETNRKWTMKANSKGMQMDGEHIERIHHLEHKKR